MPSLRFAGPIPTAGLQDDAVDADKIADGVITNAHIATAAAIAYAKLALTGLIRNADIKSDAAIAYSKLATDPRISRVKSGTYTGDGSTGQAITGVGFQPKYVMVTSNQNVNNTFCRWYCKHDSMGVDMGQLIDNAYQYSDRITSLDSDGFTVDDGGGDGDPNTNGKAYCYLAFG